MSILTFPQKSWEVWADVILRIHLPHSVCAKVESGILACPAEMFFQPFLLENKCWSGNVKISPYWTIVEFEYPYSLKISWCQFNLHISYLSPGNLNTCFSWWPFPWTKKVLQQCCPSAYTWMRYFLSLKQHFTTSKESTTSVTLLQHWSSAGAFCLAVLTSSIYPNAFVLFRG